VQKPARRRRHGEQHRVHNHRRLPVPPAPVPLVPLLLLACYMADPSPSATILYLRWRYWWLPPEINNYDGVDVFMMAGDGVAIQIC
jgi:hypothetical protein